MPLTHETTRGILHRGGTILGTSRTNVFKQENGLERVQASLEKLGLDALIPIGGEDTLGVAGKLSEAGVPVVGVPKTIDNDLAGTDFTFGFQTAVQIATDAIDRLHTTAESHNRVIVVEVMGRHAGWIAAYSGLAGGADVVLVPERPFDIEEVCDRLRRRHDQGRNFSIVVVAEGATPKDGGLMSEFETHGLVRPRPPGRHRDPARARDRAADGVRVAHDDPRPRAARRHAAGLRPRARLALRRRGDRRGERGRLREDGRAPRHGRRSASRWRRRWPSRSCSTRRCGRPPRSSSAESGRVTGLASSGAAAGRPRPCSSAAPSPPSSTGCSTTSSPRC